RSRCWVPRVSGQFRHRRVREPAAAQQRQVPGQDRVGAHRTHADRLHAGSRPATARPARRGRWEGCQAMKQPVLEIRGLDVDYGFGDQAVHAVRSANLTLHRGEVLGLAGESGSGKSTLAYGITRLLPPPGLVTGGSVRYYPRDDEPIDL